MYIIELQWKEMNIDLEMVDAKLKADHPENYKGNQANSKLELVFDQEPDQEAKDAIEAYWAALDEESDEASNYRSGEAIITARAALKEGLVAKSWDQMSVVERKTMLNLEVTKQELIDAELV